MIIPARRAARRLSQDRIISMTGPEFGGAQILQIHQAIASGAWISANDPFAVPIAINGYTVVRQLGWINGSAAGGGVDLGIYDEDWNRLVSTGAQTGSGNSVFQWIDVTDTALEPGHYYLVMARDNTTANRQNFYNTLLSAGLWNGLGCFDSTTDAYPLPDPLTNMVANAAFTRIPQVFIGARVPFA